MATWGGKREGAGRRPAAPDGTERKMRSVRASEAEWELLKRFEVLVKKDFDMAKKLLDNA